MCRDDFNFQIFLEIGYVLSNVRKRRLTRQTLAPDGPINGAQHDVVLCLDRSGKSSRDDDALQFGAINDERLAHQAEAASLVQKGQSRPVEMARHERLTGVFESA